MLRGEVWWIELPPPTGRRPVLLLSRDAAYRVRTSVTVAIITRTIRNIPVEVLLGQTPVGRSVASGIARPRDAGHARSRDVCPPPRGTSMLVSPPAVVPSEPASTLPGGEQSSDLYQSW